MGPEFYVGKADAQGRVSLEIVWRDEEKQSRTGERRVHSHFPQINMATLKMDGWTPTFFYIHLASPSIFWGHLQFRDSGKTVNCVEDP